MRKRSCELCGCVARIYCESDDASLCWDCDEKVHAANFLVAKHTRCLLCVLCHSLTPWMASAPRLGSTVSLCHTCNIHRQQQRSAGTNDRDDYEDLYDDDGESYDDDEVEEEFGDDDDEEDAENQVVPAAGTVEKQVEVVASSSSSISSGDDVFSRGGSPATKRTRNSFDRLSSDDEIQCNSAEQTDNLRPFKRHREDDHGAESELSTARISSLQRLYGQMVTDGEDRSTHRDPCYPQYKQRSQPFI